MISGHFKKKDYATDRGVNDKQKIKKIKSAQLRASNSSKEITDGGVKI